MSVRAIHGDMLQMIPRLVAEGVVCDSCVCDPPYHLTATVKRFGAGNSAPAQYGRDGAMARLSGGFMNQQWDGGDIAFRPETWTTVSTILRPGAFLVAFGGTRTYHRLACAIEDAGFVIQDCLMWLFATGFPKRRDHLKPAYEPIVIAYKPGGPRILQVDECRIETSKIDQEYISERIGGFNNTRSIGGNGVYGGGEVMDRAATYDASKGRWPANLAHDGSDEVVAMFPQSAGQLADVRGTEPSALIAHTNGIYGAKKAAPAACRNDIGSAARFFFAAKAGSEDRWGSKHPTVKPVELMKWLVKLVTPPSGQVIDPFAGSGTTGIAALGSGRNAILIERENQYIEDIRQRLSFYEGGGSHSTQAKHRNRKVDLGPLFQDAAE